MKQPSIRATALRSLSVPPTWLHRIPHPATHPHTPPAPTSAPSSSIVRTHIPCTAVSTRGHRHRATLASLIQLRQRLLEPPLINRRLELEQARGVRNLGHVIEGGRFSEEEPAHYVAHRLGVVRARDRRDLHEILRHTRRAERLVRRLLESVGKLLREACRVTPVIGRGGEPGRQKRSREQGSRALHIGRTGCRFG